MRNCLPTLTCLMLPALLFGQQSIQLAIDQLKEYEGTYEHVNNGTLELAASPRDHHLYAIIENSKYKLTTIQKDMFLNGTGDTVSFIRNESGAIEAYIVNDQKFSYLKKSTRDDRTWYAREPEKNNRYTYKRTLRPKLNDGIDIGSPGVAGLDKKHMQLMVEKVINGTYPDVHSILLLRNNKLVVEEYFYEYDRDDLHQLRSATKSFISALTGIALGRGILKSIDEPVLTFFPEYSVESGSPKNKITIRHLLTNTSGLACDIADPDSPGDETAMGNSEDWVKFTLDLPMIDTPGTTARYCSGNVILLGRILEKASGETLSDFAKKNLFDPLGIQKFRWNFKPDKSSSQTFCQLYLRPRDMAKFGLLYLNDGQWRGKPVIPRGWIKESMTPHTVIRGISYGYLWWLQYLNAAGKRFDGIAAKGNGGQRIYLFPEYDLLAVITGGSYNANSSSDALLIDHVLPSMQKRK